MELDQKIKLPSRTRDKNYLELAESLNGLMKFKLVLDTRFEDFCRAIYEEDVRAEDINNLTYSTLHAVDPSGGPYIAVGDTTIIDGYEVCKIEWYKGIGIYITFKKIEDEKD